MILKRLEKFIIESQVYNFIRFNFISEIVAELILNKTKTEIKYYSSFLCYNTSENLIFDVGANKGNKVKAFRKMGFKVVAIEPEKRSLETLYYRFGKDKKVIIVEKGISNNEETLKLQITESRSGLNTFSNKWVNILKTTEKNRWNQKYDFNTYYEVSVTTLDKLIECYGMPNFIKIDVEGFELNVILGLGVLPRYLSFESNLPEFISETIAIIERLSLQNLKVKYNYSTNNKLRSNKWLSKEEILDIVINLKLRYVEVICFAD